MPAIETLNYDVLTVSPTGQLAEIHRREARYFNENLGSPASMTLIDARTRHDTRTAELYGGVTKDGNS